MARIGDVIIKRDGLKPVISAPEPWHSRLLYLGKLLRVIDVAIGILGMIAALLGLPFGLPIVGGAIGILVLIHITEHKIANMDVAEAGAGALSPSVSIDNSPDDDGKEEG